uniref:Putative secreted protein n=1 Tax=Anopheles triannulatus TaxID=58253 RepID=A0A2M4B2L4_9DIPT
MVAEIGLVAVAAAAAGRPSCRPLPPLDRAIHQHRLLLRVPLDQHHRRRHRHRSTRCPVQHLRHPTPK